MPLLHLVSSLIRVVTILRHLTVSNHAIVNMTTVGTFDLMIVRKAEIQTRDEVLAAIVTPHISARQTFVLREIGI